MGERGKYRQYNDKEKVPCFQRFKPKDVSFMHKVHNGKDMYSRVAAERWKHYIGEKIILNRPIQSNENLRTVGGVVVGLYPRFLLIDCGFYKTTVQYTDLVMGAK